MYELEEKSAIKIIDHHAPLLWLSHNNNNNRNTNNNFIDVEQTDKYLTDRNATTTSTKKMMVSNNNNNRGIKRKKKKTKNRNRTKSTKMKEYRQETEEIEEKDEDDQEIDQIFFNFPPTNNDNDHGGVEESVDGQIMSSSVSSQPDVRYITSTMTTSKTKTTKKMVRINGNNNSRPITVIQSSDHRKQNYNPIHPDSLPPPVPSLALSSSSTMFYYSSASISLSTPTPSPLPSTELFSDIELPIQQNKLQLKEDKENQVDDGQHQQEENEEEEEETQASTEFRNSNNIISNIYLKFAIMFLMVSYLFIDPVYPSANIRATEKRILDKIIGAGYDSRIRPMGNASVGLRGGDGPAMVYVNLLIRSISRIDDVVMEYSVQVTFREQWVDSRLKFDNMSGQIRYLVLTDPNKVWRPDLFFKNEKEGHFHDIIMPNVLLRIYPEGGVLYSIRISLVLACPMNLKYYPLDKQICSIQMASYGYTTEDLMFVWKQEDPVQITTNLHLPRFTLEKYLTDYCTSKTNTGSYSCLKVDLLFKREFSYYLIQIYIPCCMLVIVSWVSFWLDPNAIPARVSLGVTTLLTMATSISGINSSLPPVSYTKAIDVWTGVCLTFVFGALLEFALVNYASRSDAHRAALKQQQAALAAQRKWDLEHAAAIEIDHIDQPAGFAMRPLVRQQGDGFVGGTGGGSGGVAGEKLRTCEIHVMPKRNWCKRWLSKFPTRSKRIDVISRIFFPLMFALFNLVYWTTYLFREDMQDL